MAAAFVGPTPAVAARGACSVNPHDAVGGREPSTTTRLGNRADVLVNNFTQGQDNTWRSVTVWQSPNFSAEVGWFVNPLVSPLPLPYKTWVNNGVDATVNGSQNITLVGSLHTFKVHDQNHDHEWSFAWDGNPLGNEHVAFDWGFPLDESERCTDPGDNLYARFTNLQQLGCTNCSWNVYTDVVKYVNNTSDFKFCKVAADEFTIKAVC
jgi:hypothetical protein